MHVAIVSIKPRYARHSRVRQRELADVAEENAALAAGLNGVPAGLTRTHSRGVSGAAVSANTTCIGLDIEFENERRDWPGILGLFSPVLKENHYAMADLVRAWTFLEAYYKAVGHLPEAADIEKAADPAVPMEFSLPSGETLMRYHKTLSGGGHLSLVWSGAAAPPVILPELVWDSVC